jgi:DNA-binding protein H-NS
MWHSEGLDPRRNIVPLLSSSCRRIEAKRNSVDILKQYGERADEIIGERTPEEQKFDREVIRWMRRGKSISKAIAKANEKYPTEALQVENDNLADVQAHYEYLAEHEAIMEKLDALKN